MQGNGKFHYTYSERICPQFRTVVERLARDPGSRQGIVQIFDALDPGGMSSQKSLGDDQLNAEGVGRIPCSMYYQLMVREGKVDLIYTMRSCDFLTHFIIDLVLALRMQRHVVEMLNNYGTNTDLKVGTFTYFTGSLHAYQKDIKAREVF